jgi:hypothetical protein
MLIKETHSFFSFGISTPATLAIFKIYILINLASVYA